jgi:hypothetical protein
LTIKLWLLPIGAVAMPALAAVARPRTSAALNTIDRIIMCFLPPVVMQPVTDAASALKPDSLNRG